MKTRSAFSTISGASENCFGSCYPKNTMSGLTKDWQLSHLITSSFYSFYFHVEIKAYLWHLVQWAERACPWACNSFSGLIPALDYRSSMFWVRFFYKIPCYYNFFMNLCPKVGWYSPDKYYFATFMNGSGFLR